MTDRAPATSHRAAPFPSEEGRYAVLILGMHRSGTSALSRLLSLAGCDLPKTLMGAAPSNAPGHWESQAVADWNDRLLASVASRWSDWQAFSADWFRSPKAAEFRQDAARLLAAEYGASHLFVLKDPRICRIAPLWFDALAELRIAPRVLLPIRNPMEVAASLAARDGMAPALGVLLWLRHVLDAEIFSRGQPRLVLAYDDLLQDWPGVLRRAGSAFGLTWPALTTGRTREIASFLSRGHRHHVQADTDTLNDPTLALWLREAFRIFRNWAAQGEDPADHAALDEIRTQFDRAAPLFAPVADLADRAMAAERAQAEASAGAAHLAADRARLQAEADALRAAVAERDTLLAQAEAERAALAERLGATDAALAQTRGRLGEVEQGLAQRAQELAAAQAAVAERDERLAQGEAERAVLEELERATAAILAETRDRYAETEQALARIHTEADTLRAAVAARETRLAQAEAERASLAERLAATDEAFADAVGRLGVAEQGLAQRAQELAAAQAAVAERDGRLAAAEAERAAEADRLLRAIAERDAWVAAMDAERLASRVALAEHEAQAGELRDRLAQLESALVQKRAEADEVSDRLRVAEANGAAEAARASELARQVGDLEGRLAERFREIATLTTLLREEEVARGRAVEAASATLAERDARMAAAEAAHAELSAAIAEREAQAGELRDRVAQLESALAQKRAEADEVSDRLRVAEANGAAEAARASDLARQVGDLEGRVAERFREIATVTRLLRKQQDLAAERTEMFYRLAKIADILAGRRGGLKNNILDWLPFVLKKKVHEKQLLNKKIFNKINYINENRDVAESRMDPLRHFINHGIIEGRKNGV